MRKLITLLMTCIILLTMTGCSTEKSDKQDNSVSTDIPTYEADFTDVTIDETVLLDQNGVKITAKNIDMNGALGPEVNVLIENNSGKNLTIQAQNTAINGYMILANMSTEVADGKKANDSIIFSAASMDTAGITAIANLTMSFHIFTTDNWEDYLNTDLISLDTSVAGSYEQTYDDSGDVLYQDDSVKIISKGLTENDSVFGTGVLLYIENNSDTPITVQSQNVSVNDLMLTPYFSADILPGMKIVDTMTFGNTSLEENDITEIKNIELSFHIFNSDTWETLKDTDSIKLDFTK